MTLALAFSILLNVLIVATFVWPSWLESRLKFACALSAGGLWLAALWETRGELRRIAAQREAEAAAEAANDTEPQSIGEPNPNDERLRRAQRHYLRGEWLAAEKQLRQAIRSDRDDFEARLWLVSVLRAADRPRSANRLLRRVATRDAARGWRTEIATEREMLDEILRPVVDEITDESAVAITISPNRTATLDTSTRRAA